MKSLKWFRSNIGKRVYRDDNKCSCGVCKDVLENGLIITNEQHADYLHMVQYDYYNEGIKLNYRKKK